MDEFEQRCEKAINNLKLLISKNECDDAHYIDRIGGKIEGVQLALGYYREEKVLSEHAFDKKREQLYDDLRKAVIDYTKDSNSWQDGDGIK
jgi:hypothetical protein